MTQERAGERQTEVRHVLGRLLRRLRDRRPQHPRGDPRRRRQLRRRLLARGDGRQVQGRRGDGGRRPSRSACSTARSATTRTRRWRTCCAASRKLLVAFGSCACEGCIPGLANLYSQAGDARHGVQHRHDRQPGAASARRSRTTCPRASCDIPYIYESVKTLDQVVPVDYYMPGCPPESHQIAAVVELVIEALHGEAALPPPGSVIGAGDSTVCDECQRTRAEKTITEFRRMATYQPEPGAVPARAGHPVHGAGDPHAAAAPAARRPTCRASAATARPPGVVDQGARMMSAVASVIGSNDPKEIERILDGIADPAGHVLPLQPAARSLLRHAKV